MAVRQRPRVGDPHEAVIPTAEAGAPRTTGAGKEPTTERFGSGPSAILWRSQSPQYVPGLADTAAEPIENVRIREILSRWWGFETLRPLHARRLRLARRDADRRWKKPLLPTAAAGERDDRRRGSHRRLRHGHRSLRRPPRVRHGSEAADVDRSHLGGRRLIDVAVIMGLNELGPVRRWVAGRRDGRRLERFTEVCLDLPRKSAAGPIFGKSLPSPKPFIQGGSVARARFSSRSSWARRVSVTNCRRLTPIRAARV